MSEPHSPAAPRWRIARNIMALATGALITVYVVLVAAADLEPGGAATRILFLLILACMASTVALDRRVNTDRIVALIEHRDARTSRQMETITTGLHQLGADVTFVRENTGDLRPVIMCAHAEALARVNGHGLDPAVLDMGDRIARRLHDG